MLDFIARRGGLPPVAYVILSGDLSDDAVWAATRSAYVGVNDKIAQLLTDAFPGVVVLPAVGNHEESG